MSWLFEMLVPALLVSVLAAVCLAMIPNGPPRLRLGVAFAGLAAWAVPWPLIKIPLAIPGLAVLSLSWANPFLDTAPVPGAWLGGWTLLRPSGLLPVGMLALFAPGFVWLMADGRSLGTLISGWRRRSSSGESLRALLPTPLGTTRAQIRIVRGTRVAAASGWLRPTIWIGDRFASEDDLRLALVHECWHIRRGDPLWIALVVVLRRAFWWNPLIAYLGGQAVLALESACDSLCAQSIGKHRYIERLAAMMLDRTPADTAVLLATARNPNFNVLRLQHLTSETYLRTRERALVAALALATVIGVGAQTLETPASKPAWSHVSVPQTPAGRALTALLGAFNRGEPELMNAYLGAYTPQEIDMPLHQWTNGLELLEIVNSERLSIEYLVEDQASGARKIGRLQVADAEPIVVTDSELHSSPSRR